MAAIENSSWHHLVETPKLAIEEIPELTIEPARILFDYYQSLFSGPNLPPRSRVDPIDIPRSVLPSVYFLEPINNYQDWVYRLMGTELVTRFKADRTGQSLRSFLPEAVAEMLVESSNKVATARRPTFFILRPTEPVLDFLYAETMSLPLEDSRTGTVWLFGGTFFISRTAS